MLEIDGNISIISISGKESLRQTHYKRMKKSKKTIR